MNMIFSFPCLHIGVVLCFILFLCTLVDWLFFIFLHFVFLGWRRDHTLSRFMIKAFELVIGDIIKIFPGLILAFSIKLFLQFVLNFLGLEGRVIERTKRCFFSKIVEILILLAQTIDECEQLIPKIHNKFLIFDIFSFRCQFGPAFNISFLSSTPIHILPSVLLLFPNRVLWLLLFLNFDLIDFH